MSITAQGGVIGFGLQAEKGQLAEAWWRHKTLVASFGPVTQKADSDPEIGGSNLPTGSYKTGSFYAGAMRIQPRLEHSFGWLLLGALGHVETVANDTTGFDHVFTMRPGQGGGLFLPWMSFRRLIPGVEEHQDVGDIGLDCKIRSMALTIPAAGTLVSEFNIVGREPFLDDIPTAWVWENDYEEFVSVPVPMNGHIKLPNFDPLAGQDIPVTGARVTLNNNTTDIREERIIGSYNPHDFATRRRSVTFEITYKWEDPSLYRFIFNGGDPAQSEFAPCIDTTDIEMVYMSPCPIEPGVVDHPWALKIEAPKVDWQEDGPVELAGDNILMQRYSGMAYEADTMDPSDYVKFTVSNAIAEYVPPFALP